MPYVKGGNAAALPKFSDMLTLPQSGGADYAHPGFASLKSFLDYARVTNIQIPENISALNPAPACVHKNLRSH